MECEFTKSDFEALIDADAGLVDDEWDGFCGILSISDKGLYLRYQPKRGETPLVDMTLFKSGAQVLPFPFTLAQFTTFCAWHPLFKWEAIESEFTKDSCAWSELTGRDGVEAALTRKVDVANDFPVDADALAELDARSAGAGVLVRHILEIDDNEFYRAWEQHCAIDDVEVKIAEISALKAMSISEIGIRDKKLAELRGELAVLKEGTHHAQLNGFEVLQPSDASARVAATPASVLAVEPASDGPAPAKRSRKPSWSEVAMPYMRKLYSENRYKSAVVFYQAMLNRADTPNSPFTKLKGELYCMDAGTTVAEGTVGTKWAEIRSR